MEAFGLETIRGLPAPACAVVTRRPSASRALTRRGRPDQASWVSAHRGNMSRLLGGQRQQLGELIIANLGLRNQDATAQMLDQIGAD